MSAVKYCPQCGVKLTSDSGTYCASCGAKLNSAKPIQTSDKSATTALLLCLFLGALGIHRFYVGKIGTGLLMLFTAGGFGIWTFVDLIIIACGNFTDNEGRLLEFHRVSPSPLKTVLTVIGVVILALIFYFTFIVCIVLYATSGIVDTVRNQLTALRAGDYQTAYSLTSSEFQSTVSPEQFKVFIEQYPVLRNNADSTFNDRKIENGTGTVKGTVTGTNGASKTVEYTLVKENGQWKILNIQLKATDAGVSSDQKHSENTRMEKKSDTGEIALPEHFTSKSGDYSINYPANWEYTQPNTWSLVISGKKDTTSYYSSVSIQTIATKKSGGKYSTVKEFMDSLKQQAMEQSKDVKVLAENSIDMNKNSMGMKGRYLVFTFKYEGKMYQQMQFVFERNDHTVFYAWAYSSPMDTYEADYPIAKAIFASWRAH